METFVKWIDDKKNDNNIIIQFLRWIYLLGKLTWLHSIVSVILGIMIPIAYEENNMLCFYMYIGIWILDILYAYVCNLYHKKIFIQRRFAAAVLSEQSSLIRSVNIEIQNNINWKSQIFRRVSEMACEKIHQTFRVLMDCETRVSIEYCFEKNATKASDKIKFVKMSGRKSSSRQTVRKAVPLEKRNKYYSYRVFTKNNKGINILKREQIEDTNIWYKNPENSVNVKKYLGIAVCIDDVDDDDESNDVRFLVQIDFLDKVVFGKKDSDEDIREFIEQYLMTYINIISLSYLLNLNKDGEISEV